MILCFFLAPEGVVFLAHHLLWIGSRSCESVGMVL